MAHSREASWVLNWRGSRPDDQAAGSSPRPQTQAPPADSLRAGAVVEASPTEHRSRTSSPRARVGENCLNFNGRVAATSVTTACPVRGRACPLLARTGFARSRWTAAHLDPGSRRGPAAEGSARNDLPHHPHSPIPPASGDAHGRSALGGHTAYRPGGGEVEQVR